MRNIKRHGIFPTPKLPIYAYSTLNEDTYTRAMARCPWLGLSRWLGVITFYTTRFLVPADTPFSRKLLWLVVGVNDAIETNLEVRGCVGFSDASRPFVATRCVGVGVGVSIAV